MSEWYGLPEITIGTHDGLELGEILDNLDGHGDEMVR